MTLEEAIKILHSCKLRNFTGTLDRLEKAHQLGIEALKRCKEARKKAYFTSRSPLPGETKE